MRLSLLGAALAGVGSAMAPNLLALGITRTIAGGCFAALIPSTLVYVGDMWPAAGAPATALGRAGCVVVRHRGRHGGRGPARRPGRTGGWSPADDGGRGRRALGGAAPAPRAGPPPGHGQPAALDRHRAARTGGRSRCSRWCSSRASSVLGVLTYLAPAVQASGSSAAVAGLVAATFGVGALGLVAAGADAGRAAVGRAGWPPSAAPCSSRAGPSLAMHGDPPDGRGGRPAARWLVGVPAHDPAELGHRGRADGAGHRRGAVRGAAVPGQRGGHRRGRARWPTRARSARVPGGARARRAARGGGRNSPRSLQRSPGQQPPDAAGTTPTPD